LESCGKLTPAADVELAVDVSEVPLDGLVGDEERAGNLTVGLSARGELGDVSLARGELVAWGCCRWRVGRLRGAAPRWPRAVRRRRQAPRSATRVGGRSTASDPDANPAATWCSRARIVTMASELKPSRRQTIDAVLVHRGAQLGSRRCGQPSAATTLSVVGFSNEPASRLSEPADSSWLARGLCALGAALSLLIVVVVVIAATLPPLMDSRLQRSYAGVEGKSLHLRARAR